MNEVEKILFKTGPDQENDTEKTFLLKSTHQ